MLIIRWQPSLERSYLHFPDYTFNRVDSKVLYSWKFIPGFIATKCECNHQPPIKVIQVQGKTQEQTKLQGESFIGKVKTLSPSSYPQKTTKVWMCVVNILCILYSNLYIWGNNQNSPKASLFWLNTILTIFPHKLVDKEKSENWKRNKRQAENCWLMEKKYS